VRSTPGWGSNFFFTLQFASPLTPAGSRLQALQANVRLADGSHCYALVVDDMQDNRDILQAMLENIGCEVATVASGSEAIDSMRRRRADIVFMDIFMPGQDGIETKQKMFQEFDREHIKIVAFSASAFEHEKRAYIEAGFDDFISKPFRVERLNQCLSDLLQVGFVVPCDQNEPDRDIKVEELLNVSVAPELIDGLRESATCYNVTRIRETLTALEQLGPAESRLAGYLQRFVEVHDVESILQIIEELGKNIADHAVSGN
jgi:CheY-like chemotaxis protein